MKYSILHAKSDSFYWKGKGSLSIKTFRNDRAYYNAGGGHFVVDEGKYLLLNRGQEYSISIESKHPVESFCIYFPDGLAEDVVRTFTATDEKLLEEPFGDRDALSTEFIEKTYPVEGWFSPLLHRFHSEYTSGVLEDGDIETYLHAFMHGLVVEQINIRWEMKNLLTRRSSTREELYKRIQIGHEYMTAFFWRPLLLEDVSKIACLSPNHFLRNYKMLFGFTPHQYLMKLRLEEAKRLLAYTDRSVTDVCFDVGFQSLGSFSLAFAKRFGASPKQMRKK